MRKAYPFLRAVAVCACGVGLLLDHPAVAEEPVTPTIAHGQPIGFQPAEAQPPGIAPVPVPPGDQYAADDCACAGEDCGSRRGCHDFLDRLFLGNWTEAGSFNCSCRGSYKWPVPPQYTYFWPGMYSQRTMTEYNSPYRFPPLKLPPADQLQPKPGLEVGPPMREARVPVRQVGQFERSGAPSSHSAPASEPVSAKIKRHYGLD